MEALCLLLLWYKAVTAAGLPLPPTSRRTPIATVAPTGGKRSRLARFSSTIRSRDRASLLTENTHPPQAPPPPCLCPGLRRTVLHQHPRRLWAEPGKVKTASSSVPRYLAGSSQYSDHPSAAGPDILAVLFRGGSPLQEVSRGECVVAVAGTAFPKVDHYGRACQLLGPVPVNRFLPGEEAGGAVRWVRNAPPSKIAAENSCRAQNRPSLRTLPAGPQAIWAWKARPHDSGQSG